MIEVSVDAESVISGMEELPDDLHEALNTALGTSLSGMQTYAQFTHRYRTRTGRLSSAIKSEIGDLTGELFIDDRIAHYGKYVHEGHGSWDPDQFIYGAYEDNATEFDRALDKAIDSAIKKAGF